MTAVPLQQQFTALGDKTRYAIIVSLTRGEGLCVSQFAQLLKITPAAISQHMKILEQAGIIKPARDGRKVCPELNTGAPQVAALAALIRREEHI